MPIHNYPYMPKNSHENTINQHDYEMKQRMDRRKKLKFVKYKPNVQDDDITKQKKSSLISSSQERWYDMGEEEKLKEFKAPCLKDIQRNLALHQVNTQTHTSTKATTTTITTTKQFPRTAKQLKIADSSTALNLFNHFRALMKIPPIIKKTESVTEEYVPRITQSTTPSSTEHHTSTPSTTSKRTVNKGQKRIQRTKSNSKIGNIHILPSSRQKSIQETRYHPRDQLNNPSLGGVEIIETPSQFGEVVTIKGKSRQNQYKHSNHICMPNCNIFYHNNYMQIH